ncbi:hypothetical protein HYT55_03990 [Candidatus Woesearchaeota archaeon]|nr:hypothetical protein [Candidatus Woesearchaeota archaeon]
MAKLGKILTNWRVLMLLFFLFLSYLSLNGGITPHFWDESVTIRSITPDSSAALAGVPNPSPKLTPLQKEDILSLNGKKIATAADYYQIESQLLPNSTVRLETNEKVYTLLTKSSSEKVDLGLRVYDSPTSNLRKGLDLEGGTRVLLKPAEVVSKDTLELTTASLRERLNVYGLSDVVVRSARDLGGDYFVLVEIAGVTENEVKDLLAKQGKFEAKIGNESVFLGGKKDITYVCRSAECSGIDAYQGCSQSGEGYACRFFFAISLSPEAAERQAAATKNLGLSTTDSGGYLDKDLVLYLDDVQVDQLKIGAELRGKATTNVQISGSGSGRTQQEAITNTLENMKRLQTVIITGSLPAKLEVVKLDTISPTLGKEFLYNVFFVGFMALVAVSAVIIFRYRKFKVVLPMVFTLLSEIVLILGFSALTGTNLDLAAIAGIIIVIGSGVNHLIIITDGTMGKEAESLDWKTRIKNAMYIVFGAYLVNFAGLLPLLFAGAGLLKGFALTTIVGASFGVLIARPAYAAVVKILEGE